MSTYSTSTTPAISPSPSRNGSREPRLHDSTRSRPLNVRNLASVANRDTISRDSTSDDTARTAALFAHLGHKICRPSNILPDRATTHSDSASDPDNSTSLSSDARTSSEGNMTLADLAAQSLQGLDEMPAGSGAGPAVSNRTNAPAHPNIPRPRRYDSSGTYNSAGDMDPATADGKPRLTYTRMSRKHLSIEALRRKFIEFELDQNPDYVIIKRWVPPPEQNELWDMTARIRKRREHGQGHHDHGFGRRWP